MKIKLLILYYLLIIVSLTSAFSKTNGKFNIYELPSINYQVGSIKREDVTVDYIAYTNNILIGVGSGNFNQFYYTSTNFGKNWKLNREKDLLEDGSNNIIFKPAVPQDVVGINNYFFVALDSGRIDISNNLGENWKRIELGYDQNVSKIIMENERDGIALLKKYDISSNGVRNYYDLILMTNNTWESWVEVKLPDLIKKDGMGWLDNIIYSNNIIGITGPNNDNINPGISLYFTTNFGKDWIYSKKDQLMKENIFKDFDLWGISGVNENNSNFYNEIIKVSSDLGKNWDTIFVDMNSSTKVAGVIQGGHIIFNGNSGFMFFNAQNLWETKDDGNSWKKNNSVWEGENKTIGNTLFDYSIIDDNKILLLGIKHILLYDNSISDVNDCKDYNIMFIYPNPANDLITFNLGSFTSSINRILVYNSRGKIMKEISDPIEKEYLNLSLINFSVGTYYFKIYSDSEIISFGKFTKIN